jgi:hypothetical protein
MNSSNKNKSFGVLFFIVFLLIGLWPLTDEESPRIVFLIFAGVFLILGLINSKILTPFNKLWIKFGELLGRVIAPIVMTIIYFIVLTPLSFLIRIFGKDLLKLKYSNKVNSYWIKREKDLGSMDRQF